MIIGGAFPAGGFSPRARPASGGAGGAAGAGGGVGGGARVPEVEIIEPVRPARRAEDRKAAAGPRPTVEVLVPTEAPAPEFRQAERPAREPASIRDVPSGNPVALYIRAAGLDYGPPGRGSFLDTSI